MSDRIKKIVVTSIIAVIAIILVVVAWNAAVRYLWQLTIAPRPGEGFLPVPVGVDDPIEKFYEKSN